MTNYRSKIPFAVIKLLNEETSKDGKFKTVLAVVKWGENAPVAEKRAFRQAKDGALVPLKARGLTARDVRLLHERSYAVIRAMQSATSGNNTPVVISARKP